MPDRRIDCLLPLVAGGVRSSDVLLGRSAILITLAVVACRGRLEPPAVISREGFAIETPGAAATAIVRLDAPAPRIPISGAPRQLRWDATHFYFVTGNTVARLARQGAGAPEVVASASMIGELQLVGNRLVWTEQSTRHLDGGVGPGRTGRVSAVARSGGTPFVLVADVATRSLAVGGNQIYFSNGDAIERIDADGGRRARLVASTGGTPLLRANGGWLYFSRQGGVSRVDDDGRTEEVANEIEIPIGLAVHGEEVVILANAVVNRPHPAYSRPARLILVAPGKPPRVEWSAPDALVANLEVIAGRARFTRRDPGALVPTLVEIALKPAASR